MDEDFKYLEYCILLLEKKVSNVITKPYKRKDYIYLTDDIYDKTNILLNYVTLKRLWELDIGSIPQIKTLDAISIYLGFKSWYDFKLNTDLNNILNITLEKKKKKSGSWIKSPNFFYYSGVLLVILLGVFILKSYQQKKRVKYDDDRIVFEATEKVISGGTPTTVMFNYDLAGFEGSDFRFYPDNFIKKREKLFPGNKKISCIYVLPGVHRAKLYYKDRIVKQQNVYIPTNNWQTFVNKSESSSLPIPVTDTTVKNGGLVFVTPEIVNKHGINGNFDYYDVHYLYVKDFGNNDGDHFKLETKIKNDYVEGYMKSQYSKVCLIAENGNIEIPFCGPGYGIVLKLILCEIKKRGSSEDLSFFCCDLMQYQKINIINNNKKVSVYRNDKFLSSFEYKEPMGRILGIKYFFYGCGSVDYVRLSNKENEVLFSDNFNPD